MRYWVLLVVIVIAVVIGFLLPQPSRVSTIGLLDSSKAGGCSEGSKRECTTPEGYVGFRTCSAGIFSQQCFISNVDECTINADETYRVCCKSVSGRLFDCTEKTSFKSGEYIIVKTNLQKAIQRSGLNLDLYKACGFSKLSKAVSQVPSHYQTGTSFSNADEGVGCSSAFSSREFHQGTIDGFIPSSVGKVRIVEWRAYPTNTDLSSSEKAFSSISRSSPVFSLEVDVGE